MISSPPRPSSVAIALLALATIGLLVATPALAENVTWTGGGTNQNWDNPDNWDGGRVPNFQDDVSIPAYTPAWSHRAAQSGSGFVGDCAPNTVTWQPVPTLPGGVYIMTARSGDARLGGRLIYIR